jgi:hypothetical protein
MMKKIVKSIITLICIALFFGCNSISHLEKTKEMLMDYNYLLDQIDSLKNEQSKKDYLNKNLKKVYKVKKYRDANIDVMLYLSENKNRTLKLEYFIESICDSGFFKRGFEMDSSVMFYRFGAPNEYGLGLAYLSDRYNYDYFDEQTALSKNFVKDFSYVFPRIYFIRDNKISILSGDLDLSDRKEFKRMATFNDTIFEKIYTYRKDNNDPIIDLSYHFRYVTYSSATKKWEESISKALTDSIIITKDLVGYIDYPALKNIYSQTPSIDFKNNIELKSPVENDKWFYAGTVNKILDWESNNTNIKQYADLQSYLTDTTKYLFTKNVLYVRNSPPGEYSSDKKEESQKGKINGSIYIDEKIYVSEQKKILDFNGDISIWLKVRKTEKLINRE